MLIYNDNQTAQQLARNHVFHAGSKNIDIRHYFHEERSHGSEVHVYGKHANGCAEQTIGWTQSRETLIRSGNTCYSIKILCVCDRLHSATIRTFGALPSDLFIGSVFFNLMK